MILLPRQDEVAESSGIHAISSDGMYEWLSTPQGRDSISQALYKVFTWKDIEPIYGQPWAESAQKATEAHSEAARRRRGQSPKYSQPLVR